MSINGKIKNVRNKSNFTKINSLGGNPYSSVRITKLPNQNHPESKFKNIKEEESQEDAESQTLRNLTSERLPIVKNPALPLKSKDTSKK